MSETARRFSFPRRFRLSGKLNFAATYEKGTSASVGPLKLFGRPNGLPHPRLGLSVPRRVGTAPRRNAIKRRLREALRMMQHDFQCGHDLIIVVRPHEPLGPVAYQSLLGALLSKIHGKDGKRELPRPR